MTPNRDRVNTFFGSIIGLVWGKNLTATIFPQESSIREFAITVTTSTIGAVLCKRALEIARKVGPIAERALQGALIAVLFGTKPCFDLTKFTMLSSYASAADGICIHTGCVLGTVATGALIGTSVATVHRVVTKVFEYTKYKMAHS